MNQQFCVKKIRGEDDFCVILSRLNPKKCLSAQKTPITNSVSHTLMLIDLPTMIDDSVLFELKSKGNQIFKWRSKLYGNIKSNGNLLLVYHNLEYSFDDSEEMYLIHKIANPNNSIFDKCTNVNAEKETNVLPSNLTYKDFDKSANVSSSNKYDK